jgi:MtN3 and saliva related transmembrane protein
MHAIVLQLPSWMVDLIGSIAAVCTTISFVPQLIRVYQLKSAHEISLVMFLVFSLGVFLWLLYGIFIRSFPVIVANAFTLALSLAILALKIRYDRRRRAASAKIEKA